MNTRKTPFSEWEPALSAEEVFSDTIGLHEIGLAGKKTYWLEMRPAEQGRYVIVQRDENGTVRDITPAEFNVRTRVHEYGGGAYTVFNNAIYFVNFKDQRIYQQFENSSKADPLTPIKNEDGSLGKYAALTVSPDGTKLLVVYEKEYNDKENENFLAVLELNSEELAEPTIIAKDYDFYADPVFAPTGEQVAWLQWNHPNMPWDSTEIMIGTFEEDELHDVKKVAGGSDCSVCFPRFDTENKLYFVMDKVVDDDALPENWWNLYCYDGKIERITSELAEFGEPHWIFGQSNYDFLSDNRIIAKMVKEGTDYLVIVDPEEKSLSLIETSLSYFSNIKTGDGDNVFFIGASSEKMAAIYSLDINAKNPQLHLLKKSSSFEMKEDDMSLSEFSTYSTRDEKQAHAFLYLPKNSRYLPPDDEKPPLLVLVHGGPTARTNGSFSFIIQFWTSAGFAVIDVDYRGSTSYGRRYRDALRSQWGVLDAGDVVDAVKYLVKEGKVDASKIAVRGGSAGGYVVQRVLTEYPDLFSAGASYFGIGNLITLVEQTHKFESRYTDNLVGTNLPEGKKEYENRSPITHLDRLKSPLIIFQGSEDKIVTPDCSREVAQALAKRGIEYEYVEYEGESHGFRMKKNRVDSLIREFNFYRKIFRTKQERTAHS
jgi:dipeptidyl aminopeptidase/acylaminoacyl peptidase